MPHCYLRKIADRLVQTDWGFFMNFFGKKLECDNSKVEFHGCMIKKMEGYAIGVYWKKRKKTF